MVDGARMHGCVRTHARTHGCVRTDTRAHDGVRADTRRLVIVLLIRHGLTAANRERRYMSRTDQPLCAEGARAVRMLGLQYRRTLPIPDTVFSSPMTRCLETARLMFPAHRPRVVDGLRECDFGIFEGRTAEELSRDVNYRVWVDSLCEAPIPGGESPPAFEQRCVTAFLEALAGVEAPDAGGTTAGAGGGTPDAEGETPDARVTGGSGDEGGFGSARVTPERVVACVTHGGCIRALRKHLCPDSDIVDDGTWGIIPNGAALRFRFEGGILLPVEDTP